MYYIYLDDLRYPTTKHEWELCRNVKQFKEAIEQWLNFFGRYGDESLTLSFDHDLGDDDEPTGYDAVKWLVEFCMEFNVSPAQITLNVHSANPVGKKNIEAYWENFQRVFEER